MGFNLAEAAGFGSMMSNLDTREVEMIPVRLIDGNEKNFFTVEDVQDLKESIEVNGILQPLNVVMDGTRYRIIAGHRRFKAASELGVEEVPAIVLPQMSEAMEQLALIQTNTTARELSYPEKMEAAIRLKKILLQLKEEGVELPGKLRDIMAEQLEISRTELARMNVIEKSLIPEGKQLLKEGKMTASAAYAMARTSPECQKELIDQKLPAYMTEHIEDYAVKRTLDWITEDCPHPDGWGQNEIKRKGRKLECPSWKRIHAHKEKGHPERCPGCCSGCSNLPTCKDACRNAENWVDTQKRTAEQDEKHKEEERLFRESKLSEIPRRFKSLMDELCYDEDDIEELWGLEAAKLGAPSWWTSPTLQNLTAANCAQKLPRFIFDMFVFCKALDIEPNWLYGYNPGEGGWHDFIMDEKPMDGQRVIVRRNTCSTVAYGEYIYRDEQWFNPGLDEFPMNITGVTHWIEVPE